MVDGDPVTDGVVVHAEVTGEPSAHVDGDAGLEDCLLGWKMDQYCEGEKGIACLVRVIECARDAARSLLVVSAVSAKDR